MAAGHKQRPATHGAPRQNRADGVGDARSVSELKNQ